MSEFKINYLPEKYESIILPLNQINDKFVLGGSLALHILDIMEYDFTNRQPDLDISLLEALTKEELEIVKDFFNLTLKKDPSDYSNTHEFKEPKTEDFLKRDLIQLFKTTIDEDLGFSKIEYVVDFFTSALLPAKEVVVINYKEFKLRLTHPSVILAYKSKYAYDNRVGKQYKHFQDLQNIDWKKYFSIIKKFNPGYKTLFTPNGKGYNKITHYQYDPNEIDSLPY